MRDTIQAFLGISTAILSSAIVLGSIALSLAESGSQFPNGIAENSGTENQQQLAGDIRIVPVSPDEIKIKKSDATQPTTSTEQSDCIPDTSGTAFMVLSEGSIAQVAQTYGFEPAKLIQLNCLSTGLLSTGQVFYIPLAQEIAAAEAPASSDGQKPNAKQPKKNVACGAPSGWATYVVRRGDTLSSLASKFGISVSQLQSANCIKNPKNLRTGQSIRVPFVQAIVAQPTAARKKPTPVIPTQPPAPTATEVPPKPTEVQPTTEPPKEPTPTPKNTPLPPPPTDTPPEPIIDPTAAP